MLDLCFENASELCDTEKKATCIIFLAVLYAYYKEVDKCCINRHLVAFEEIYESCHLEYESEKGILRRLLNCFSKAFSNKMSDGIRYSGCQRKLD